MNEKVDFLLEKIKSNDETAFDELYDLVAGSLYKLAYSYLLNREDSKDVVSEAFYLIYKNIKSFKGKN